MQNGNLFDLIPSEAPPVDWSAEAPPSLDGIDEVEIDFETSGLRWWAGDLPIGLSLRLPDGSAKYYPWGHLPGGNLDEGIMKRWAQRELRGKRITNLNTKFEVHMFRAWGVDLEEQGCTVADVGHYAALLDDHRLRFSLEALSQDYLQDTSKWGGVDKTRMRHYHPSQVAEGAVQDVVRVGQLKAIMRQQMTAEGLDDVRQLEEQVIWPVVEMEHNAAPIDVHLLGIWAKETQQALEKCFWKVFKKTGLNVNPDSSTDLERLFKHLGIDIVDFTEAGRPSFTDAVLKKYKGNEIIDLIREAGRLADLRNKYIIAYQKAVTNDGYLRFNLHQLRTTKDAGDKARAGTVSGRFSMTDENLQQVMAVEKQIDKYGDDYIIRELFIANRMGMDYEEYQARKHEFRRKWLSADAAQIEYRLLAHYAESPKIIEAYRRNPDLSFHKEVWAMLLPFKPDLLYKPLKNLNFAHIYGAGLIKKAVMMEFITEAEGEQIRAECESKRMAHRYHPKLLVAAQVEAVYNREIPEVKALSEKAKRLAEERGYVRTIMGRRSRFPNKMRTHKALNGVIQGGAADVMKMKLVELHKERKNTGFVMRLTVHDEVGGDSYDERTDQMVDEILNRQSLDTKVPIRWEVTTGENWMECADPKIVRGLKERRAARAA